MKFVKTLFAATLALGLTSTGFADGRHGSDWRGGGSHFDRDRPNLCGLVRDSNRLLQELREVRRYYGQMRPLQRAINKTRRVKEAAQDAKFAQEWYRGRYEYLPCYEQRAIVCDAIRDERLGRFINNRLAEGLDRRDVSEIRYKFRDLRRNACNNGRRGGRN